MSKKNFDLSDYSMQTTQAKNNKYSAFIENEESKNEKIEAIEQDAKSNNAEQYSEENTSESKEKRVNMAFTDNNYEFIVAETSKLGVNFMYFLNYIINSTTDEEIEQFMKKQPLHRGRGSAPRRRGHPLKRINFKISTENHKKLNVCALKNDSTITTIVNSIIEIYIAKNNINTH